MAKKNELKQPPIIGMEQVRHVKLDRLCESIGAGRDEQNALRQQGESDEQAALDYMIKKDVHAYHHHGTELIVRPGAVKLNVRKFKGVSTMPGDEALGE